MCERCGCDARLGHEHTHWGEDRGEEGHAHSGRPHSHRHDPPAREPARVRLEMDLLAKNNRLGAHNRALFALNELTVINLIGSPGAGKTALLEASIPLLAPRSLAVLEGDQATARDAERIRNAGCPSVLQINTGTGCHLDATMIERGLAQLQPAHGTVLFVENVGNLVCPALFDLGERARVVVMSITEGEDKPLKYPYVFRGADLVVLTKLDLADHTPFDRERCLENIRAIHPGLEVVGVSARSGGGLPRWCDWVAGLDRGAERQELRA